MSKRIVVVGAGIIGASIAWHLVREGCHVVVVDAATAGGVATPNSFAWINASWGNPEPYYHFRRRSMAQWRELEKQLPQLDVNWCGTLLWDLPSGELEAFAKEQRSWGYDLRWVGPAEMMKREPNLRNPPVNALFCPEEGSVEPAIAARCMLDGVVAAGGRVVQNAGQCLLLFDDDEVIGVQTASGGQFEADDVILAVGAATSDMLTTIGVRLATTAPAGLIAHSTIAPAGLLNGILLSPECHVRQTREGRLIIGANFAGGDPEDQAEAASQALLASAKELISGAETLDVDFVTVGYRPTPADGYPAIGRPSGIDGIYVAMTHSGVTLAPIIGQLVASEVANGNRDRDLDPFDPNRSSLG